MQKLDISKENYYTPDVEDIRVGYECEYETKSSLGWIKVMVAANNTTVPKEYNGIHISNLLDYLKQDNWIRTPYLTREQIEAEGWILSDDKLLTHPEGHQVWVHIIHNKDYKYVTMYVPHNEYLSIRRDTLNSELSIYVYQGKCKSINEFRTIIKWLEI